MSNDTHSSYDPTTWVMAIRDPKRGKAHRLVSRWGGWNVKCDYPKADLTEHVPLSQTTPEDRCKICWPVEL